jgi:hypothetical protein
MICPRHTEIVETLATPFGTLVREDYYGYPESESNVYMVDAADNLVWFAERPIDGDAFANPLHALGPRSVRCSSWKGFDCEIDLHDGKLVQSKFTR